ncbi:MAG: hypothetical protein ACRDD7_03950 [Peptostreptococcaceae bacterium]
MKDNKCKKQLININDEIDKIVKEINNDNMTVMDLKIYLMNLKGENKYFIKEC